MGLRSWFENLFQKKEKGLSVYQQDLQRRQAAIPRKENVKALSVLIKEAYEQGHDLLVVTEDLLKQMQKHVTQYNTDLWKQKMDATVFKWISKYYQSLSLLQQRAGPALLSGDPARDLQKYNLYKNTLMIEHPARFKEKAVDFLAKLMISIKIRQESLIKSVAELKRETEERRRA